MKLRVPGPLLIAELKRCPNPKSAYTALKRSSTVAQQSAERSQSVRDNSVVPFGYAQGRLSGT